jgi:hypothetical protein
MAITRVSIIVDFMHFELDLVGMIYYAAVGMPSQCPACIFITIIAQFK